MNTSVRRFTDPDRALPLREVDILWLRPSRQVRQLAVEVAHRIPRIVRYLMRGLGSDPSVTELTSYLLFDPAFCEPLIELGRADVRAERRRIDAFFAKTEAADRAR